MATKILTWEQFDALKRLLDTVEEARTQQTISGTVSVSGFSATWDNNQVTIEM